MPQDDAGALQARIAALREQGGWRLDPVRLRYLEALYARAQAQPHSVRALLQQRLAKALADDEARLQALGDPPAPVPRRAPVRRIAATCAPLAELNLYIRQAAAMRTAAAAPDEPAHGEELASVRHFRRAWSAGRSEREVEQALQRRPANAGPLNSHALVLHALDVMRELSPDYLRRFVLQVESLQWLEQAREAQRPAATKTARRPLKRNPPRQA